MAISKTKKPITVEGVLQFEAESLGYSSLKSYLLQEHKIGYSSENLKKSKIISNNQGYAVNLIVANGFYKIPIRDEFAKRLALIVQTKR